MYDLDNVSFNVFEKSLTASNKTFYFNVPSTVYDDARRFTVQMQVEEIIDQGGMDLVIGNVYYYLGSGEIVEGLNLVDVEKTDVKSGTNKMRVESSTGRFKIKDLKLVWE